MTDLDWKADVARVGERRAFFREQSLWAIRIYRFGRSIDKRRQGPVKAILVRIYWVLFRLIETITGISLPKEAIFGPGIRIWHFGGIFVHPDTRVGKGCTLRQGVTLGNRYAAGPCPTLGDNVELGAYAQVLGGVTIGDNCRIGAMAVVLQDVPSGASAVGNPARLIWPEPL
jgi:serine O-acetyltransferase